MMQFWDASTLVPLVVAEPKSGFAAHQRLNLAAVAEGLRGVPVTP